MRLPTIVHLDADAFFVSVEQAFNPSLRGKKVAVGGAKRGIISSASYEARACGVYTPMPSTRAVRVCPDLILVPHRAGVYGKVSRRMFELCETVTPLVQRNSIDEGYMDLTPCGHTSLAELEKAVHTVQQKIWDDQQITVSFGLAANKLVAQIASKLRKPRGFVVVMPGTEADFLAPLPVGKLPGVGPKTEQNLVERHRIRFVKDLLAKSDDELESIFGNGWRDMVACARGEDDRPVEVDRDDAKSYSQQETFFEDVGEFAAIEQVAKRMVDELMPKIRQDGKRARTITVKVRYPDFSQESHGHSLPESSDLESAFYPWIAMLLRGAWKKRRPLRLISVRFSGIDDGGQQLEMFAEGEEKRRRLAGVLDKLNQAGRLAVVQHGHQLSSRTNGVK